MCVRFAARSASVIILASPATRRPTMKRYLLIIAATILLHPFASAFAGPPVEVVVRPVGDIADAADHPLSADAVARYVTETLTAAGYTAEASNDQALPDDGVAIRVMYIVSEHDRGTEVIVSTAASTELLRTERIREARRTYSMHNGIQQSLASGEDRGAARAQAADSFRQALKARLTDAMTTYEAAFGSSR